MLLRSKVGQTPVSYNLICFYDFFCEIPGLRKTQFRKRKKSGYRFLKKYSTDVEGIRFYFRMESPTFRYLQQFMIEKLITTQVFS